MAAACVEADHPAVSSIYGGLGKAVPVVIFVSIVPVDNEKFDAVTLAATVDATSEFVAGKVYVTICALVNFAPEIRMPNVRIMTLKVFTEILHPFSLSDLNDINLFPT
ncbi:MAG: hypothetical protein EOP54_30185 [Sphingobacteriales bacterium]|nr:MAG: hypothetical protein EOP54_30185 [Sphingobacteriales bacterium]